MTERKPLLVFAHRGEAKAFLQNQSFRQVPFAFPGVYESPREWILISGEGANTALAKTAAVCGAFRDAFDKLINLGIAGSLTAVLEVGKIYSVRIVFLEAEPATANDIFYTADPNARYDCITARQRVEEESYAARLASLAHIVDREAWAVGYVSRLFHIPFYIFKLISDVPAEEVSWQNIKRNIAQYSERLYQYYLHHVCEKETV